jgi:hypothetical protein
MRAGCGSPVDFVGPVAFQAPKYKLTQLSLLRKKETERLWIL